MIFINPANHPESYLSGSTIESMINKTKELGIPYFACTDHNNLTSVLKGYNYSKEKDIKFIAGVELFFKDKEDPFKYSKIIVHAKDQEAYQKIVRLTSDDQKPTVNISNANYKLFGWSDLEELSKYNVSICTSNVECMVSKYLLIDQPEQAELTFKRLFTLFGDNLWLSIIPFAQNMYWSSVVQVTVNGETVEIPATSRIETDRWNASTAFELTKRNNRHKKLKAVYLNKVRFGIKEEYQDIESAKLINKFEDMVDVQTKANQFIIELAKKYDLLSRILINSYSYYSQKGDKVVQDMKLGDENRIFQHQFIMANEDAIPYLDAALNINQKAFDFFVKNSYEWAKQFDNFKLDYSYRLPEPEGDPQKILVERIKEMGRMKWDDPRYVTQFREEFDLLTKNNIIDLIPYFLPIIGIYDFYAKNGHLTGPGRGSAGGFLISYLIGITHVDPIKYGLSTSRFLTIDRVQSGNLPDIDCDLESRIPLVGKDGNSGYLFNKYGKRAAQVSTRTLLRIKSAILDANRFMNGGTVEPDIAALSKSLPTTPQGINDQDFVFGYEEDEHHVEGLLEINLDLKKYSEERPKEWDIVKRALSLSRQHSRHACAFIISDTDIENTVPIMEVGGIDRVTQPEHKECESAGLIKYDFLVVSALKDINLCIKYINKKNGNGYLETGYFTHNDTKTYTWDLPEDQKVFKMLWEGKTETVFQLNSATATPLVKDIMPESILDCAVITSLGRPGPLDFIDEATGRNMAQEYAYRKRGESKGDLPILDQLLPETYGVLVFQEQVTKIARELGQMNIIDSENVRIGMGKKKIKLLNSLKPAFIEGASKKTDPETAEMVWSMMATFARYGFNKSHAVGYSIISYACAFLKHHYSLEWWAAVLSNADDKEINEVFYKYVKDMVLPPDVNTSSEQMEVDYALGKIRNKLSVISGLGKTYAQRIIDQRPYTDLEDFVIKDVCGPALARKLIYVGALDSLFEPGLEDLTKISMYEEAVAKVKYRTKLFEYRDQIVELAKTDAEDKEIAKIQKRMETYAKKGPKQTEVPESFIGLNSKQSYQIKKSVFPTMNLDLMNSLKSSTSLPITKTQKGTFLVTPQGEYRLLNGEHLQSIDNHDVRQETYFCVPGYIMDTSEFTYQNGSRKALKMIIDSSGYVSEKVLWPDYETGELLYSPDVKKGAIVYILYNKRPGKPYTNIRKIIIEENSILS